MLLSSSQSDIDQELVQQTVFSAGNEINLRVLFEYAPDAMVVVSEEGDIVRVNNQAEALFQYTRSELVGQSVEMLLPQRFRKQHVVHRVNYMAESRLRPMGADLELFGCRKDGSEVAINIMLSPIEVSEQKFVIAVIRDITPRKQFEEALRQSESRFRALFEQSPYALFLSTPEDQIVDVNPAACKLVGYKRRELLQMEMADLLAPEVRQGEDPAVQGEFAHSDFVETISLHRAGHRIPVEARTTRLDWEDQSLRLSIVRDIVERKLAETQLLASLQEKEVMLKEIHHRVKNNLQIISSLLKLQANYINTPEILAILQESQNRVRAMALVHETLYQSQDLASIDFAQYVTQLITYLRKAYGSSLSGVSIHLDIAPVFLDLDTAVSCGLVINELVSNALKYAFPPSWGGKGEVYITLQQDQSGEILLQIQDNGIGFPEDLDFSHTESLGLQLVNTLVVDELDGTITLKRENGTLFTIALPKQNAF